MCPNRSREIDGGASNNELPTREWDICRSRIVELNPLIGTRSLRPSIRDFIDDHRELVSGEGVGDLETQNKKGTHGNHNLIKR